MINELERLKMYISKTVLSIISILCLATTVNATQIDMHDGHPKYNNLCIMESRDTSEWRKGYCSDYEQEHPEVLTTKPSPISVTLDDILDTPATYDVYFFSNLGLPLPTVDTSKLSLSFQTSVIGDKNYYLTTPITLRDFVTQNNDKYYFNFLVTLDETIVIEQQSDITEQLKAAIAKGGLKVIRVVMGPQVTTTGDLLQSVSIAEKNKSNPHRGGYVEIYEGICKLVRHSDKDTNGHKTHRDMCDKVHDYYTEHYHQAVDKFPWSVNTPTTAKSNITL